MTATARALWRSVLVLALLVIGLVLPVHVAIANTVTYNFQGIFNDSAIIGIPNGTLFSGTLSYDTAALATSAGPNYGVFSGGSFSLSIGLSNVQAIGQRVLQTYSNIAVGFPSETYYNRDLFTFTNYITLATTGPLSTTGLQTADMEFVLPVLRKYRRRARQRKFLNSPQAIAGIGASEYS